MMKGATVTTDPVVGAARRVRLTGAQRREEIIAAAQTVFAANGLAGARTSNIADAAGIAESMLYRHFASKQELFEVAVVEPVAAFVEGMVDDADRLLDRDGAGSQKFYEAFLTTMRDVLPLLGVALFSDSQDGRRFYNDKIVPLFDRYEAKVTASLEGVPATGVSAAFLARAVIGIVFLLTLDATYRGPGALGPADIAATAEVVRTFVANGLTGAGADGIPNHAAAEADVSLRALDAENQALRRIVADQAIELQLLRDGPAVGSAVDARPQVAD